MKNSASDAPGSGACDAVGEPSGWTETMPKCLTRRVGAFGGTCLRAMGAGAEPTYLYYTNRFSGCQENPRRRADASHQRERRKATTRIAIFVNPHAHAFRAKTPDLPPRSWSPSMLIENPAVQSGALELGAIASDSQWPAIHSVDTRRGRAPAAALPEPGTQGQGSPRAGSRGRGLEGRGRDHMRLIVLDRRYGCTSPAGSRYKTQLDWPEQPEPAPSSPGTATPITPSTSAAGVHRPARSRDWRGPACPASCRPSTTCRST